MGKAGFFGLYSLIINALWPSHLIKFDDGSYQGYESGGVVRWLGMRYASAPVGDLRFAEPQDPSRITGIFDAREYGKTCVSTGASTSDARTSEDCLFINVQVPAKARPTSKLPVYVFIQGGGFNTNANANLDASSLIHASGGDLIVVTFNYRVGLYGFLASKEIETKASLNNGLKDQRKALKWVQSHINKFGGDPNLVTIGGASAGAGSVALHLTAYGGRDDKLFHAASAESPAFPVLSNVTESQYQYDALVERTRCAGQPDTLACLRGLSFDDLQRNNVAIPYPGAQKAPLYSYAPTIDDDLVQDYTYRLLDQGHFIHVPTIVGADANDGSTFVPRSVNSQQGFDNFLITQFPRIKQENLDKLHQLYPADPQFGYWRATSNAYGEIRYTCPALKLSSTLAGSGASTWQYVYNVSTPAGKSDGSGATHVAELAAIWGTEKADQEVMPVAQGYWTSFIRTQNPNESRAANSTAWERFSGDQQRLAFQDQGVTSMQAVPGSQKERCEYLWSMGVSFQQ